MSNTAERVDELEAVAVTSSEAMSFEITSTEQMFQLFQAWHEQRIGILQHMLSIPDGTVIEDTEGVKHALSGEYLAGFRAGIDVALMELDTFPIKANISDEPA